MPTITTANTIFPTVTRQWYRVTPVTAGETFTVTDAATNTPLPVQGNDFFAISDAGVKVSVDAYILPFELAPSGASTSTSGSVGGGDCNVTITDRDSIVCGANASANGGGGCISIGYNAQTKETTGNIYNTGKAPSWNTGDFSSVAYGANTSASYRGVAIGGNAKAGNPGSSNYRSNTAIGFNAKAGVSADGATASGYSATASGYSATASGSYATASGSSATASGYSATASGYSATASGSYATASGSYATASGSSATASGYSATASGYSATASGSSATASGYSSVAIGAHVYNDTDGTTAVLAGFDSPTEANNWEASVYQMHFFIKNGKPHIGFVKYQGESCGWAPPIAESYAIDLSQLPHVAWTPPASRYTEDLDGNPVLKD